jgi:DNA-binding response OmpR family regulator
VADTSFIEVTDSAKTIVIVDDQPTMRSAMKRILEKESSFQLFEFSNGNDAINFLKSSKADLVITDLYMDRGSGFDLLLFIRGRAMANDIPVVIVSGEATRDDIVYTIDVGASDYILKPFEPQEFLQKVQTVIQRFKNPSDWELKIRTAEWIFLQGKTKEAAKLFHEILTQDSTQKSPRALAGLAQCYMATENFSEAEKLLIAATKINGLYFPAYAILADIYLKQNEREKAKSTLIKELSINGKQPQRRLLLARLYAGDEGVEKATEEVRKGLIDTPRDKELLLYAADLAATRNDEEKAAHYYLRTRKSHPTCVRSLEGLADLFLRRGKPEKAHFIFKDLLKANPKAKDIYYARAKLYEQEKNYDDALADVEVFLSENESHIDALKLKAKILTKRKNFEAALQIYLALQEHSSTADLQSKIAITYIKLKNFKQAILHFENAIDMDPQNPNYFFNMGYAFEVSKNYPKAIDCYQRTQELDPASTDATSAIQRIRTLMAGPSAPTTPKGNT